MQNVNYAIEKEYRRTCKKHGVGWEAGEECSALALPRHDALILIAGTLKGAKHEFPSRTVDVFLRIFAIDSEKFSLLWPLFYIFPGVDPAPFSQPCYVQCSVFFSFCVLSILNFGKSETLR